MVVTIVLTTVWYTTVTCKFTSLPSSFCWTHQIRSPRIHVNTVKTGLASIYNQLISFTLRLKNPHAKSEKQKLPFFTSVWQFVLTSSYGVYNTYTHVHTAGIILVLDFVALSFSEKKFGHAHKLEQTTFSH